MIPKKTPKNKTALVQQKEIKLNNGLVRYLAWKNFSDTWTLYRKIKWEIIITGNQNRGKIRRESIRGREIKFFEIWSDFCDSKSELLIKKMPTLFRETERERGFEMRVSSWEKSQRITVSNGVLWAGCINKQLFHNNNNCSILVLWLLHASVVLTFFSDPTCREIIYLLFYLFFNLYFYVIALAYINKNVYWHFGTEIQ